MQTLVGTEDEDREISSVVGIQGPAHRSRCSHHSSEIVVNQLLFNPIQLNSSPQQFEVIPYTAFTSSLVDGYH